MDIKMIFAVQLLLAGVIGCEGSTADGPHDMRMLIDAKDDSETPRDVAPMGDAGVDSTAPDARPDGNDDFLFCPVGCVVAPCQSACTPLPSRVEPATGGQVQFRGRVTLSRTPGDWSETCCGTLHEHYNCGTCWGSGKMDRYWPRFSFNVENVLEGATLVRRVRAEYSWNGKDKSGKTLPQYSLYTAIMTRIEVRLRDPLTNTVRGVHLYDEGQSFGFGLNFGGFLAGCNGSHFEYTLDVPVPKKAAASDTIEVVAVGNYE